MPCVNAYCKARDAGMRANRRRKTPRQRQAKLLQELRGSLAWWLPGILLALALGLAGWKLEQRFEQVQWRVDAPMPLKTRIEAAMRAWHPQGIWGARPHAVRQHLLRQVQDIDSIQVTRTLPNSLRIRARPRQAVALWESPEGLVMLVDARGEAFRTLERGERLDLPFLRLRRSQLGAAVELIVGMRQVHSPWLAVLSEVFADLDGWRLNLSAGQQWLIPFGKESLRYVTKITALLQQPRWSSGTWRIDARQWRRWFIRPAAFQGVT